MKLDTICERYYKIFKTMNWKWGNGGPRNPNDIKNMILSLRRSALKYATDDVKSNWVSSGRIRVHVYKNGNCRVTIDDMDKMYINKEDLMVELI